jgi:hypothetical protein
MKKSPARDRSGGGAAQRQGRFGVPRGRWAPYSRPPRCPPRRKRNAQAGPSSSTSTTDPGRSPSRPRSAPGRHLRVRLRDQRHRQDRRHGLRRQRRAGDRCSGVERADLDHPAAQSVGRLRARRPSTTRARSRAGSRLLRRHSTSASIGIRRTTRSSSRGFRRAVLHGAGARDQRLRPDRGDGPASRPDFWGHAAVWLKDSFQSDLGFMGGGHFSEAYGINDLGGRRSALAAVANTDQHAFLWKSGQLHRPQHVGAAAAHSSIAYGINNNGLIRRPEPDGERRLASGAPATWFQGASPMPPGVSPYTHRAIGASTTHEGHHPPPAPRATPSDVRRAFWAANGRPDRPRHAVPDRTTIMPASRVRINAQGEIVGEGQRRLSDSSTRCEVDRTLRPWRRTARRRRTARWDATPGDRLGAGRPAP